MPSSATSRAAAELEPACRLELSTPANDKYIHASPEKPNLQEGRRRWPAYKREFLDLMRQRRIEGMVSKEALADGCLLCSEDKPRTTATAA
jgi:hypothetical protein